MNLGSYLSPLYIRLLLQLTYLLRAAYARVCVYEGKIMRGHWVRWYGAFSWLLHTRVEGGLATYSALACGTLHPRPAVNFNDLSQALGISVTTIYARVS